MTSTRLAALPLAASLACTFDGTGLISGGPPDGSSSSPASTSGPEPTSTSVNPTSSATQTTGAPDTSTSSTTEALTSTTAEPSTGTTLGPGSTGTPGSTGGPVCGNDVQEGDEACDGTDLADQTCATLGFPGGALMCDQACAFDFTSCDPIVTCGNGKVDPGEDCDGDVGNKTCVDVGYDLGTLACASCKYDTSMCVGVPDDWADVKYLKRRKLTITKDKLKGVLTDFPVVLALTDAPVVAALAPASKLMFSDTAKAKLSHELELDEAGRLIVWVELDLDAAEDEVFYVYYGNPAPPPDTEKPAETWSNKFLGVWHLDEPVTDEQKTGMHADSTESGHTGMQSDNAGVDNCKVGPCQQVGNSDWIDFAKNNEFKLGAVDATIATWYRSNTTMACALFAKSNVAMPADGHMILGALADGKLSFEQLGAGKLDSSTNVLDGQWHYIAWTQVKDEMGTQEGWHLYVDGMDIKSGLFEGKPTADAYTARLGGNTANSEFPTDCHGTYDEMQISLAARSADWIVTAFKNQGNPTTFVTVGAEEDLL